MENPFELIVDRLTRIENLLSNQRTKEPIGYPKPEPGLLTIDQAAEFLCLSKSTIYKMTAERTIPHFKLSKRVYFKPQDLEDWVSKYKVKTVSEIEQEAATYLMTKHRRK
jgi:excisionase family DNA binding protein